MKTEPKSEAPFITNVSMKGPCLLRGEGGLIAGPHEKDFMAVQIQLVLIGSCEYTASVAPAQPAAACFLSCLGPPLLQAQLLRELEHRVTQDTVTRQQLDIIKTSGMETLLKDVEQKEQKLQLLTEEAERASKRGQLQQQKMDRDLKQVRAAGPHPNGLPPWNVRFLGLFAPVTAFSLLCRFPFPGQGSLYATLGQLLRQDCCRLRVPVSWGHVYL